MLRINVILSTRQDGFAGLGAKDLVSSTRFRFFSRQAGISLSACLLQAGRCQPDGNNNTLGNVQKYYLTLISTMGIIIFYQANSNPIFFAPVIFVPDRATR